ncbi:propanediol utilization protein [Candidatus Falkowbacteria bacterium CG10_big_fil_rev_8_21_14_0_10_43_11]|uniref:Phosphate propanoyltransferase n=1 Tax=Candidatus Falkowbacteria bacterium CG10_big_fil_rev_8_21_14_0_10_43_11 TaxID=1974568 RepID=A0A2M6WM92_9BACT|nr:MAG: propanediol utilization protein [Candidatus Falkowbacteria bacterium CG10_big_fil_rev_8_21_14_0_10_43_11]
MRMIIPIEVSRRHAHLSLNDLAMLFGQNYQLTNVKNLLQPGEFACEEKILLEVNGKKLTARIVGPARAQTQIEICASDAATLAVNPPRRLSGDLKNSAGIKIIGPKGSVYLNNGLILAQRHVHLDGKTARDFKLKNGQTVAVKVLNQTDYIFNQVAVRVNDNFKPAMHIDADEAKAAGIGQSGRGEILQK